MAGAVSVTVAGSDSGSDSEAELYKDRNHLQLRSWQSALRHNSGIELEYRVSSIKDQNAPPSIVPKVFFCTRLS